MLLLVMMCLKISYILQYIFWPFYPTIVIFHLPWKLLLLQLTVVLSDSLQKFKWNEMSKDMFRNTPNSSEIFTSTEQLINKFCDLKHAPEQINVDEMISSVNSIIMRAASSCLTQKQVKRKGKVSIKVHLKCICIEIFDNFFTG